MMQLYGKESAAICCVTTELAKILVTATYASVMKVTQAVIAPLNSMNVIQLHV